jgi:AraC-like DNA-binding protein
MDLMRQQVKESPTAARALSKLGAVVGLSRSTVRRQLRHQRETSTTATKDSDRRIQVQQVALELRTAGYRPITAELHRRKQIINHKVVLRLLKEEHLLYQQPRP